VGSDPAARLAGSRGRGTSGGGRHRPPARSRPRAPTRKPDSRSCARGAAGVNIGPNLTYTGSLATLLWRRVLHRHGAAPDLREFTIFGLLTVPAGLCLAVLALWAGLQVS
jgi:hypothetical protein